LASKRIVFVVNPRAGKGAAGRQWPKIWSVAKERLGSFATHVTSGPGDATRLARQAVVSGAEIVMCVGGDGTLNEVINGLMGDDGPRNPGIALGYLPWGTGCDLNRSLPLARDVHGVFDNIFSDRSRPMDLGRLIYRDGRGKGLRRYFHNVLSFGLGGEVDERVNRATKALGGFMSFIWATLLTVFFYDRKRIYLRVDDHFEGVVTTWNVAVANGQYHGGGMCIAPGAVLDDGLFQVTVIGDLHLSEVLYHFPKLYKGNIYAVKKVQKMTGKHISAASRQPVLIDLDGEQPGHLPVVAEIVPSALRIISG
jgi:diacylglycerol kinase (ATP)